jgi:hypothetical protein
MIRSHHITAELARQHQSELLHAGRAARGGTDVDPVATADAAPSHGGTILRHWRGHVRRDGRTVADRQGAQAQPQPLSRSAA